MKIAIIWDVAPYILVGIKNLKKMSYKMHGFYKESTLQIVAVFRDKLVGYER
jgi:hypothetical protein